MMLRISSYSSLDGCKDGRHYCLKSSSTLKCPSKNLLYHIIPMCNWVFFIPLCIFVGVFPISNSSHHSDIFKLLEWHNAVFVSLRALEMYEFHYITNNSEGLILIHVNETPISTVELSRFKSPPPPPALAGLTCDRAAPDPPGAVGWTPRIPRGSQTPTQACAAGAPVYKTISCVRHVVLLHQIITAW